MPLLEQKTPAGRLVAGGLAQQRNRRAAPDRKIISPLQEGLLGWIKRHHNSLYLTDVSDEMIFKMWGFPADAVMSLAILPLEAGENHQGMLVVVDPNLQMPPFKIHYHLDVLAGLLQSGINNRLLYDNLKNSEEEYRDLFENASTMVLVVYPDGVIRECNRAFAETLGLSCSPTGQMLNDVIKEVEEHRFDECWQSLLLDGEATNVPLQIYTSGNEIREIQLSGNARVNAEGFPTLIRLYMQDVTEQRTAERRRHELELEVERNRQRQLAQLGLYVSGIAHNLQNPVQVLLGYIDLLKYDAVNLPQLDLIEQSTLNIMKIIKNLLYKMNQERKIEETDIDLNELLDNELTFLNANMYYKHEVKKEFSFSPEIPHLRGVYSDFSQAILNIIFNALDAMVDSPVKILSVKTDFNPETGRIVVTISDTGKGIPKEIQEKIFHPFFSTKSEQTTTHGITSGSGLGLSSSVTLLKNYHGEIDFTSEVGAGTTFWIFIPVGCEAKT